MQPKPLRRRWLKLLAGVPALILVTIGLLHVAGRAGTGKWNRYADKLREDGMPLTYAEIAQQQRAVSEGPTVAGRIIELSDALPQPPQGSEEPLSWTWGGRALTPDTFAGITEHSVDSTREYLAARQGLLDDLAALRDRPPGRFPAPTDANSVVFANPWLYASLRAVRLLRVQAVMSLVDGDLARAIDIVRLQRRISEALDEHPMIISRLAQANVDRLMLCNIENILGTATLRGEQLGALEEDIESRMNAATMKWALYGERAGWVAVCDQLVAGKEPFCCVISGPATVTSVFGTLVPDIAPTWLVRKNQMLGTEMWTRLIDVHDDSVAALGAARRIDRESAATGTVHFIAKAWLPNMVGICVNHTNSVAHLRCAYSALGAERFRMAKGRLPESIEELVPEFLSMVPADPLDGQPMRFAVTDQGIVIYSVGEDLLDDRGDIVRPSRQTDAPDVGFRLLRPEHRGLVLLAETPPAEDD